MPHPMCDQSRGAGNSPGAVYMRTTRIPSGRGSGFAEKRVERRGRHLTYFARPLANIVTPWFYKSRLVCQRQSLRFAGLFSVVALTGLLFLQPQSLVLSRSFLFYVVFVLDCVDGNLARLDDRATYWGNSSMDWWTAYLFPLAPSFAGVGWWLATGDVRFLIVGFGITLVALATQMIRNRLSFFREWMVAQSGDLGERGRAIVGAATAHR